MSEFFKTLLKGVIYILLLPVIVAFLAIVFAYCVGVFLYTAIRNLIIFFSGGNPGGDLKEDVEAKRRIAERFSVMNQPAESANVNQTELVTPSTLEAESSEASLPALEEEQEQTEEGGNDDGNSDQAYRI